MAKGIGKNRLVHTTKFNDGWYRELSREAKVVLEYIRCNCMDCGVIEVDESLWAFLTNIERSDVGKAIDELVNTGKVVRVKDGAKTLLCEEGFLEFQQGKCPLDPTDKFHIRIEKEIIRFEKKFSFLRIKYLSGWGIHPPSMGDNKNISPFKDKIRRDTSSLQDRSVREGLLLNISKNMAMPEVWKKYKGGLLMELNENLEKMITWDAWCQFVKNYGSRDLRELVGDVLMQVQNGKEVTDALVWLKSKAKYAPDVNLTAEDKHKPKVLTEAESKKKWVDLAFEQGGCTREILETAWETEIKQTQGYK